jgi:hypothetical protein
MPECKTRDRDIGISNWLKFKNAIQAWRVARMQFSKDAPPIYAISAQALLDELNKVKQAISCRRHPTNNGMLLIKKSEMGDILGGINKLTKDPNFKEPYRENIEN